MPVFSLAIFVFIALFFVAMVQIEFLEIAFAKLGLTPEVSLMILIGTLIGCGINLPLYALKTRMTGHFVDAPGKSPVWEIYQPVREGKTIIAMNVGGCLIPLGLCLFFISQQALDPVKLLAAIAAISALSYRLSQPIPGRGVAMPIFIAPLVAVVLALILAPEHAAQFAYICGVLGVLIGADILHLKDIPGLGSPIASIGGAGTFDGIFLTGIIAALLA
jgi:uncharacterized membrane protein